MEGLELFAFLSCRFSFFVGHAVKVPRATTVIAAVINFREQIHHERCLNNGLRNIKKTRHYITYEWDRALMAEGTHQLFDS